MTRSARWNGRSGDATGFRLREDLLAHLGPMWSVFPLPSRDRDGGVHSESSFTEYALVVSVDDIKAFAKVLESAASGVNHYLRDLEKPNDPAAAKPDTPDLPVLTLERLPAPDRGYRLTSPSQLVFWLDDNLQPTLLIGKSHIALASNLDRAKEALGSEQQDGRAWQPVGELSNAFACLPENLSFLMVGDTRDSIVPDGIAKLPKTVQLLSTVFGGFTDPAAPGGANLLAAVGIPGPGSFRLRIDPSKIPKADALRGYLFPSVLATSVDAQGVRLISREAFPLACVDDNASLKSSMKRGNALGFMRGLNLGFGN